MSDAITAKSAAKTLADMAAADGGTASISYQRPGEERVEFQLEPSTPAGELPDRVLDELVRVRTIAKDYASSYSDAVKTQAEKYQINVAALKRFIAAKCDDKLDQAQEEADALAKLLDK